MTDARSAGADPGAPEERIDGRRDWTDDRGARIDVPRRPVVAFFRANPQVFVLLIICLVLGLGTFLAVLFGLVTAGSDQTTGEPSGVILGAHLTLGWTGWLRF